MKRSVILTDRLGPDILSAFWTKGHVLHRERAHLKVPGFSIVLNVLLTRKLPTFLSRSNEISGGCEKIAPVSGSFCRRISCKQGRRICPEQWKKPQQTKQWTNP